MEDYSASLGYSKSNMRFVEGRIEDLRAAGVEDGSVDLIISNCVVNLCPDKDKVFLEAYRVLAPGGEMHFSDMYATRRLSAGIANNQVTANVVYTSLHLSEMNHSAIFAAPFALQMVDYELVFHSLQLGLDVWLQELWGEGVTGAQYREDFISRAIRSGFPAPRILTSAPVVITDARIKELITGTQFVSETYRLFKVPGLLERTEEDYGQLAQYEVRLLQLLAIPCHLLTRYQLNNGQESWPIWICCT